MGGYYETAFHQQLRRANIEFIQFWILDPYLEDPNLDGGELYFNLGSVSEDILKDGRQSFENGLSPIGTKDDQDSTVWGYVPQNQPVVDAFSNEAGARDIQDVGLDALNDAEERTSSYNGAPTYLNRVEAEHGVGSGATLPQMRIPVRTTSNTTEVLLWTTSAQTSSAGTRTLTGHKGTPTRLRTMDTPPRPPTFRTRKM